MVYDAAAILARPGSGTAPVPATPAPSPTPSATPQPVNTPASTPAAEGIAISEAVFPDPAFRSYVKTRDPNGDGILSPDELAGITRIECPDLGIASLEGIRSFPRLEYLDCSGNAISVLDIGGNPSLTYLDCRDNGMTELFVEHHSVLGTLLCSGNRLAMLDISGCMLLIEAHNGGATASNGDLAYYRYDLARDTDVLSLLIDNGQRVSVTTHSGDDGPDEPTSYEAADTVPEADDPINMANVLALLDAYSPDSAWIIRESRTSEAELKFWIGSNTFRNAWSGIDTAVHEQCHDFTNNAWNAERIYTGDGEYITVPFTSRFDTIEIVPDIPEQLRTFRFDTYVNIDEELLASRQHGAYGLLNEFTAYYWGMRSSVELWDYYKALGQRIGANVYPAYAEFRFYILRYMMYARDNHPDVYEAILANDAFREAFTFIDSSFGALVSDWIEAGGANYLLRDDYDVLMDEMEKPEYVEMAALLRP